MAGILGGDDALLHNVLVCLSHVQKEEEMKPGQRRKRGHRLHYDGPGRTRERLAEMLKEQCGIDISPYDLVLNRYPEAKYLDLCRWCGDGKFIEDGGFVHVCSWDTMTEIVRYKKIEVVDADYLTFEVCTNGPKNGVYKPRKRKL